MIKPSDEQQTFNNVRADVHITYRYRESVNLNVWKSLWPFYLKGNMVRDCCRVNDQPSLHSGVTNQPMRKVQLCIFDWTPQRFHQIMLITTNHRVVKMGLMVMSLVQDFSQKPTEISTQWWKARASVELILGFIFLTQHLYVGHEWKCASVKCGIICSYESNAECEACTAQHQ